MYSLSQVAEDARNSLCSYTTTAVPEERGIKQEKLQLALGSLFSFLKTDLVELSTLKQGT
jgi:hypothetical protein